MSTLRLRVESQPLKRFRLSEVPEFIRHRAANRDAATNARHDGLWGALALDYVIEAKRAALFPDKHEDEWYYVSQEAWDEMMANADKLTRSGAYKNWLPQVLDPPEPPRRHRTSPTVSQAGACPPARSTKTRRAGSRASTRAADCRLPPSSEGRQSRSA